MIRLGIRKHYGKVKESLGKDVVMRREEHYVGGVMFNLTGLNY